MHKISSMFFCLIVVLFFHACAKHACENVEVTEPWMQLGVPDGKRVVCASTPEKLQAHFLGNVSEVSKKVIEHFEAKGYKRTTQDLGEMNNYFQFSNDTQTYTVEVYEWDDGTGVVVKPVAAL